MEAGKSEKESKSTLWPYAVATLAGMAAGVAAGLLLAPDTGEESRRKLAAWIRDRRAKARQKLSERREQIESVIEAGRKAYREPHRERTGV